MQQLGSHPRETPRNETHRKIQNYPCGSNTLLYCIKHSFFSQRPAMRWDASVRRFFCFALCRDSTWYKWPHCWNCVFGFCASIFCSFPPISDVTKICGEGMLWDHELFPLRNLWPNHGLLLLLELYYSSWSRESSGQFFCHFVNLDNCLMVST